MCLMLTCNSLKFIAACSPSAIHFQVIMITTRIPILKFEVKKSYLQLADVVPQSMHGVFAFEIVAIISWIIRAGDTGFSVPYMDIA